MVVMAKNVDEARKLIHEKQDWLNMAQFDKEPDHVVETNQPAVFYLPGSS
jgi:hypothetical protein